MSEGLPRISLRRKLLILALAVATAVAVVTTLLDPPGGVRQQNIQRVDQPACSAGQTERCVGGKAGVIVVTPASAGAK